MYAVHYAESDFILTHFHFVWEGQTMSNVKCLSYCWLGFEAFENSKSTTEFCEGLELTSFLILTSEHADNMEDGCLLNTNTKFTSWQPWG